MEFFLLNIWVLAWSPWALRNFVYEILLKEVGYAKLGESNLHPISPKTPAVSNCFVYIKMLTTNSIKHFLILSVAEL